ncbi:MAG: DUF3131 domain-containing protein [Rhodobacteraceae bacterium]|nr:MAG: DUF3131 domain-containing protein [Paracoccaceae bacterium]
MQRRQFLSLGAGLALSTGFAGRTAWAQPRYRQGFIILKGLDRTTSLDQLRALVAPLLAAGVPVSCLVEAPEAAAEGPGADLLAYLGAAADRHRGVLELVPEIPRLALLSPYFRARAVHDTCGRLVDLLGIAPRAEVPPLGFLSVACRDVAAPQSPEGVRSGGIRTVLALSDDDRPVRSEVWPDGTLRIFGGRALDFAAPERAFAALPAEEYQSVALIDLRRTAGMAAEQLASLAEALARQALMAEVSAGLSQMTLSEALLRDNFDFSRYLGLHFLTEGAAPEALMHLRADLEALGLGSSFGPDPGRGAGGLWVGLEAGAAAVPRYAAGSEVFGDLEVRTATPLPEGQPVEMPDGARSARTGLAGNARLILPALRLMDLADLPLLEGFGREMRDFALLVGPDMRATPARQTALRNALLRLAEDAPVRVLPLEGYLTGILPRSPQIEHFRRTRTLAHQPRSAPQINHGQAQQDLLEDARIAWSYFETWTNPETGLCPATVNSNPGALQLYESVTMWDVGSHLNALMAAVDLELISEGTFQAAARRILPNIVGRETDGRRLPSEWIRTDRFKWGNRDFDGCDAGRLLAALYNYEFHPFAHDSVAELVLSWDLEQIIFAGEIHDVLDRGFRSTYLSHCAHYAAIGFEAWGLQARSPYRVLDGRQAADDTMRLLEAASRIGPIGTEPLLLEAMDFRMSPESALLAEVLFAAQKEAHARSGKLYCVSESPIDRSPWFVYHGLQLDAPGLVWTESVDLGSADPEAATRAGDTFAISCKAAYLWNTYRPSEYSDLLVNFVRERARGKQGFSSAIYQATGQPTRNYSDINTNSIILQAIARKIARRS